MSTPRVLFKLDPSIVVTERTEMGPGFDPRTPAIPPDPFARFPFAAAFCAGIPFPRDIAGPADRAHLVQIEDEELVDAIDRDRALRAAVEREVDTVVVDDRDAMPLANNDMSMLDAFGESRRMLRRIVESSAD